MAKDIQQQTTDENELIKIRREKLQVFIDKGAVRGALRSYSSRGGRSQRVWRY